MKNKRILIIGPIFNTPSGPSGQGGELFVELSNLGFNVIKASHFKNRAFRMLHTLVVVLKFWKYDIIHLQSFGLLAFFLEDVVSLLAFFFRKPIIFTLHGGAFFEFYEKNPRWVITVLNRASLITTPSQYLQSKFNKLNFNIKYIPNGLDLSKFPSSRNPKPFTLLWVRAFHDIYNPELAILSVHEIKKSYPNVKLVMIGPDQGSLVFCKRLISQLGLETNVDILGYIPNDKLHLYYNTHYIYLNTTRYESFGVALMEAASCGIPIISTNVGEIPLIWENGRNILFADRTPQDFSNKITSLFEDKSLYNILSKNAEDNSKRFSWKNVIYQWVNVYKNF